VAQTAVDMLVENRNPSNCRSRLLVTFHMVARCPEVTTTKTRQLGWYVPMCSFDCGDMLVCSYIEYLWGSSNATLLSLSCSRSSLFGDDACRVKDAF
jgi:hypothetical protein